ncbi:uncharacterized protein K452DRAFT_73094 [Aplosporella prunicola CBS 121167]|uniref:Uncharacterized protein n=1 Tax=Aplosporella prunicola CBS 121167 TaxID=1176127 RepID=A0A6A6BUR0_9PEZI|nr:uncharacterized protein K452DRAFT_73094 [Aplosporella prunicola CBS 121167]KAF2146954.1 hypothetical protein K452DRAFT_73094 [Aplosporella prunicola CBS 121167]
MRTKRGSRERRDGTTQPSPDEYVRFSSARQLALIYIAAVVEGRVAGAQSRQWRGVVLPCHASVEAAEAAAPPSRSPSKEDPFPHPHTSRPLDYCFCSASHRGAPSPPKQATTQAALAPLARSRASRAGTRPVPVPERSYTMELRVGSGKSNLRYIAALQFRRKCRGCWLAGWLKAIHIAPSEPGDGARPAEAGAPPYLAFHLRRSLTRSLSLYVSAGFKPALASPSHLR